MSKGKDESGGGARHRGQGTKSEPLADTAGGVEKTEEKKPKASVWGRLGFHSMTLREVKDVLIGTLVIMLVVGVGVVINLQFFPNDRANAKAARKQATTSTASKSEPPVSTKRGAGDKTGADDGMVWQDFLKKGTGKFRVMKDSEVAYKEDGPLYLIIAGFVFDVSKGRKTYDKEGSYHGFIGKDGTRAFITGKFDEEGLIPDISGLDMDGYLGISKWIDFYLTSDKYDFVGLHVGHFFNEKGQPTKNLRMLQQKVAEGSIVKAEEAEVDKIFPSCNMEWSQDTGSRLYCSRKSGGIDRDWVGVPRVFHQPGKEPRCACIHTPYLDDPRVKEYDNCDSSAIECRLKE